ncbi:MAG: hypothetical protein IKZ49_04785, partial [Alphaproteobacteria bacterium]|nr:hypothetical protein [Alphaproteobacteria bacterium]
PTNTENSFPSNGLMAEDTTYTNAATSTNMAGVYENEVNAVAEYENILYQIGAGQYLPAGGESVISCDQPGSFCPGVSGDVTYNANSAQGLSSCSTATNGDFTSSDGTGSSAESCYRACDINNMGANGSISSIAHATAISGNDYYGNGTDTCVPTACENGWHVKPASPDLMTVIGASEAGTSYGYLSNNGESSYNDNTYGITNNGEFVIDYGNKGTVHGHAQCSTRGVTNPYSDTVESDYFIETLPDSTGQYCYCHLDSYTANGSQTSIALTGPWVFHDDDYADVFCARDCANFCSGTLRTGLAFRAAVFNAYPSGSAMCEANTITINWTDASSADISANNAGTATYGEDVRTPVKATTKPGQRFKGWRFVAPTPVQVGN